MQMLTGNTLPWCGTVLVDGQAYTWMGIPSNCAPGGIQATQRSMSFTASKTTFVMQAGTVNVGKTVGAKSHVNAY